MYVCFFAIPITPTTNMGWWFRNFDVGYETGGTSVAYPTNGVSSLHGCILLWWVYRPRTEAPTVTVHTVLVDG
jgi:hypothetical protein